MAWQPSDGQIANLSLSDSMEELSNTEGRDRRVLELYERLLEMEQRLIPTGLHVFGRPPDEKQLAALLQAVASFDRYEQSTRPQANTEPPAARALTDLVAEGLGLPSYSILIDQTAQSEERALERERVESVVRQAIAIFLEDPDEKGAAMASSFLLGEAGVSMEQSASVLKIVDWTRKQLQANGELDSLAAALRGEYIEPGPGADIIQNPGVLPTGRNTHAVNPYAVPSPLAVKRAGPIVDALLDRHRQTTGRYPETMAMVLWGIDNIKTQGEAVAQALCLMGVVPRRDSLNRATDVEVIPLEVLGRPRIDVVMTVSGIFRDLFGSTMALLDRAVHIVAALEEPYEFNFVRRHVMEQASEAGTSLDDAAVRVFSNAAGNYGTNVNFMVLDSQWDASRELGELFVTRKCFAYGRGKEGRPAKELLDTALARVELTYQNIDSTEVGITDVDHYFEYLGGVSKAVHNRSGAMPAIYLSDSTAPAARVRTLEETVKLETRTKTLNPKWYEGMLSHGFSGVAEIEHHVTNTFGWSATADAVDKWIYDEVVGTFVLDEQMLARLKAANPHAVRSMVGRLLEASGRGLWAADEGTLERLRQAFEHLEDELEGVAV
jgi:magnesium chelatase subunit H